MSSKNGHQPPLETLLAMLFSMVIRPKPEDDGLVGGEQDTDQQNGNNGGHDDPTKDDES